MGKILNRTYLIIDEGYDTVNNRIILHPENKNRKALIDDVTKTIYKLTGKNYLREYLYTEFDYTDSVYSILKLNFDQFCYWSGIKDIKNPFQRFIYWWKYKEWKKPIGIYNFITKDK